MKKILILAVLAVACADEKSTTEPEAKAQKPQPRVLPDRVTVDHILIGVIGELPVQRSQEDARMLTDDILDQLDAGADWSKLKNRYSEDPPSPGTPRGGPYTLDRHQARRNMAKIQAGIFSKDDMVKSFGDVSFELEVGEIGVAEYDATDSKFGFHIIKRIK